jgi:hypothetical protein
MRDDYHVLSKGPLDGSWDLAALLQKYLDGGYDGLNLRFASPPPFGSLDFLGDYNRLRYLEINAEKLGYDLPAFGRPELEELILLTKSTRPIPGFASARLVRLGLDDRPGKGQIASLKDLRELLIWRWREANLGFLGDQPLPLRKLHLEGSGRKPTALNGIEVCRGLVELEVVGPRVESLQPLRALDGVEAIKILPSYRATGDAVLDLDDIAHLKSLKELHLIYVGAIRSLHPLLELPALQDLRLGPVDIGDGDLSPLSRMPDSVNFGGQLAELLGRI